MPQFYNNTVVVIYEELVPQFFSSEKSLSSVCKRNEIRGHGMFREAKGGNGRLALVNYDSLPEHIKRELADPRANMHILEKFFSIDAELVRKFQDHRFFDGTGLSQEHQFQFVVNGSVLNAVRSLKQEREYERHTKGYNARVGIWQSLSGDAASFNSVLLKQYLCKHSLPGSYKRFRSAFERYFEEGYLSLIPNTFKNKNSEKVSSEVEELLVNLFADAQTKPNAADVYRIYEEFRAGFRTVVNTKRGEMYLPTEFPELSQATVRNYLMNWENKSAAFKLRSGNRQVFMQQFSAYGATKQSDFAGTIISVDDRQPPFWYDEDRNRVWFYMGFDDGSECFTVWVHAVNKQKLIIEFYRQMVRNYWEWGMNLPLEIECESSLNSAFRNTLLLPGKMFKYVRIEANNARGKKIEQKFRPMRYGLERKEPGWLGRPAARLEANQARKGQEDVKKHKKTYNEIVEFSLSNIEEWNNSEHSKISGKTRWEVFCERQNPNTEPINWQGILPYIGYKQKSSVNAGHVRFRSTTRWWLGEDGKIATGESLINLLKQVNDQQITIYWLDSNASEVMMALIYIDDRYVCQCLPQPEYKRGRAEQTEADIEALVITAKYKATIDGFITRNSKELDSLMIVGEKPRTLNNKFKINGALVPNGKQAETRIDLNETPERVLPEDLEPEELHDEIEGTDYVDQLYNNF